MCLAGMALGWLVRESHGSLVRKRMEFEWMELVVYNGDGKRSAVVTNDAFVEDVDGYDSAVDATVFLDDVDAGGVPVDLAITDLRGIGCGLSAGVTIVGWVSRAGRTTRILSVAS